MTTRLAREIFLPNLVPLPTKISCNIIGIGNKVIRNTRGQYLDLWPIDFDGIPCNTNSHWGKICQKVQKISFVKYQIVESTLQLQVLEKYIVGLISILFRFMHISSFSNPVSNSDHHLQNIITDLIHLRGTRDGPLVESKRDCFLASLASSVILLVL